MMNTSTRETELMATAKRSYLAYNAELAKHSCPSDIAESINPMLTKCRLRFMEAMNELIELDPSKAETNGNDIIHTCHWPECKKAVPPTMWGCKEHWFKLPQYLRNEIWANYRPGQEIDKRPSDRYIKTAKKVQKWIKDTTK